MEFAIVVLAFLGLGYVLDRLFDTKPLFMIVLVVLSLIGQFASMWYGYDARMTQLEAERRAKTTAASRSAQSATPSASPSSARRLYAPAMAKPEESDAS